MMNILFTSTHVWETWKQQGKKEIEDDQIAHEDSCHEVRNAGLAADKDAVPHGLYPLSAQHSEHDHEAVHEVGEVPSWHGTTVPVTNIALVVLAKQLHPHHGKDEDDDAEDKGQVGQCSHCVHHNGQYVVERLPWFRKFEHSEQPEGSEHG